MAELKQTLTAETNDAGQRLDLFCVSKLTGISRAAIQKAVKSGQIRINGREVKPRQYLAAGDIVDVNMDLAAPAAAVPGSEDIQIPIIYEDEEVLVINKPAGLAVHTGVGQDKNTVNTWFVHKHPEALHVGEDVSRSGIVHRLDKDTSGVLILAKTAKAYQALKEQFERRHTGKEYLALVFGVPGGKDGRINRPLKRSKRNPMRRTVDEDGKEAITEWRLEKAYGKKFALLRLYPLTGRMHQLRAHMHFLGYPIVGDTLYTYKRQKPPHGVKHQLLHAEKLTLDLPSGRDRTFVAPLPEDFRQVLEELDGIR